MIIHRPFRKWQPLYTLIEATVVGLIVGIAWQLAWQEIGSILVSCFGIFFVFQQSLGFARQMKSWPCKKYFIVDAYMFAIFFGVGLFLPPISFPFFALPMAMILVLIYFLTIRQIKRFSNNHDRGFLPAVN